MRKGRRERGSEGAVGRGRGGGLREGEKTREEERNREEGGKKMGTEEGSRKQRW